MLNLTLPRCEYISAKSVMGCIVEVRMAVKFWVESLSSLSYIDRCRESTVNGDWDI